jgi:hypothetical protein
MRFAILLVLVATLFSCGGEDELIIGNKTSMEVKRVHDAGEVIKGEMIIAKFEVTNTGDYPLILAQVRPSCSCTVSDFTEEPIQPGEKGMITAHIDTDKVGTGIISKNVHVTANTEPSITQLKIKAKVIKK